MNKTLSSLQPIIIDGGISNVIEKMGYKLDSGLWTAALINDNPEVIVKTHLAYLEAGSHCITTTGYQSSIIGWENLGYNKKRAKSLLLEPSRLAEEARDQFLSKIFSEYIPLIASSIGPYGAVLGDGSEYHGHYEVSDQFLIDFHTERIEILERSDSDIYACETIPNLREAIILAEILEKASKPYWISFSCKDDLHISNGTSISECVKTLRDFKNIFALGVNCTHPSHISSIISEISKEIKEQKIIVYPNSGKIYDSNSKTWSGNTASASFVEMSKNWIENGAQIVGGCCGIGPSQIKALSDSMRI